MNTKFQFRTIEELKKSGFSGFIKISDLRKNNSVIPQQMGVYMIVRESVKDPVFLETGSGGHFKGKNPNVTLGELKRNCVVYIGKAGSVSSRATLRSRLLQYLKFGDGMPVGHWGGRYIWQLEDHEDLLMCWKPLSGTDPSEYESNLIDAFRQIYGDRPFANLSK